MALKRLAFVSLFVCSISLLVGCGGGGGGGNGGGGASIPTASNAAITPPPSTPIPIATGSENTTSTTAATTFQSLDGAGLQTLGAMTGVTGVNTSVTADTRRLTVGEVVRRHAEKIKDHQPDPSVIGAQVVQSIPCFVSGTYTLVFDDASGNASEIFVNCDEGGVIFHGTVSSSGVSANVELGSSEGSPYTISVAGTITIDLSITVSSPAEVLVTQGSFSFGVTFSGQMESDGAGGLIPGFPTSIQTEIAGASLLASDGVNTEQLSNFNLTVLEDSAGTTINGGFTYANSAIGGAVTVNITTPVHYPPGAFHPDSGVVEITTSASTGKIKVTFSASPNVTVEVYANASDPSPTDTYMYTWAEFEAFI